MTMAIYQAAYIARMSRDEKIDVDEYLDALLSPAERMEKSSLLMMRMLDAQAAAERARKKKQER